MATGSCYFARSPRRRPRLRVPYYQHVAVLDDVLFAFEAQQALFTYAGVAAEIDEVLPVHDLRTDELLFEIGMDRTCGFDGGAVDRDRPCAHFGITRCEETHGAEKTISGLDDALQTAFFEAIAEQILFSFGGPEFG